MKHKFGRGAEDSDEGVKYGHITNMGKELSKALARGINGRPGADADKSRREWAHQGNPRGKK